MFWLFVILWLIVYFIFIRPRYIRFFQKGIQDEWHFVIGNAAGEEEPFYKELETQLASQIQALRLKSGYKYVGNLLRRKRMHYVKFGSYVSLTHVETFGQNLKISWFLYFSKGDATAMGTGFSLILHDIFGHFTGKTRDRIIAFGAIGKDAAQQAAMSIIAKYEPKELVQSGNLGVA